MPLLLSVLFSSCTGYQPSSFYQESLGRSTGPDFSFRVYHYFTGGVLRSDLYLAITNSSLQFTKDGEHYVASYSIAVSVMEVGGASQSQESREVRGPIVAEKNWTETVTESSYDATVARTFHISPRSFSLQAGVYTFVAEVTDERSKRTMQRKETVEVPDYQSLFFALSSITIGSRYFTHEAQQTLVPDIIPEMSTSSEPHYAAVEVYDQFPGREIVLDFKLYGSDRYETPMFLSRYHRGEAVKHLADTLLWSRESTLTSSSTTVPVKISLPDLPYGHYLLVLTMRGAGPGATGGQRESRMRQSFSLWPVGFPEVVTLDEQIEVLEHIATPDEFELLRQAKTKEEKQLRLTEFWARHWNREEYYKRAEYANRYFSCVAEGWRTPFGWAYIVVGPPEDIQISPQGVERWRYTLSSNRALSLPFIVREFTFAELKCKYGAVYIDPALRRELVLLWKKSD